MLLNQGLDTDYVSLTLGGLHDRADNASQDARHPEQIQSVPIRVQADHASGVGLGHSVAG